MPLLEAVLYSIVKYRAMKQRSSYLILNHVLYHKKVELRLASNIPRLRNTRLACLFAQENMLSMWTRQVWNLILYLWGIIINIINHYVSILSFKLWQVPFARSSLNHDDIFILDTKSKIFQFNGSNSSIQERAKALEVVQYIKDTYHDGKCEVAAVGEWRIRLETLYLIV